MTDQRTPDAPRPTVQAAAGRSGSLSPTTLIAVATGGMLGTAARYGITQLVPPAEVVPWATLLVNLTGSFALGFLVAVTTRRPNTPPWVRPLLATGVLGAYTTFSTFAVEVNRLLSSRPAAAVMYTLASVAGGMAAAAAGLRCARR